MLTVNNTQSENNIGIVGSTSSLIAQLIEIYTKLSVLNSALNVVDTKTERLSSKNQAENIKDGAEHKAKSMRWQAGAGLVAGAFEIGGGLFSMGKSYFDNQSLQNELDNINKYKDEINKSLQVSPDAVLSNGAEGEAASRAKIAKKRMQELTHLDDFKDLDENSTQFKADSKMFYEAEPEDRKALNKHLDDLSVEKKKEMMSSRTHELTSLYARGLSGIANGIGGMFAANQTNKAGINEAESSLDQTSVGMMQSAVQQAAKTADKYAEMASQIIEVLVQLSEADVFRS
ncbi:hypothetical protein [Simkania negevensis]|uniref:Uncharacterized protein n=1 Tax=Simkania negevensis (strain ATCC VR-1471 / DSM 27360 / Z) TaxID=331113 RepID=F8L3I9_SIMNZ|nr:hypothetical protein [Simkania negevensis]CCB89848.1 unknown protein [Simkania negevensis Z]